MYTDDDIILQFRRKLLNKRTDLSIYVEPIGPLLVNCSLLNIQVPARVLETNRP